MQVVVFHLRKQMNGSVTFIGTESEISKSTILHFLPKYKVDPGYATK